MGKQGIERGLDKEGRKRLSELEKQWRDSSASSWSLERFTPADLRLMLMHFSPLRDLVSEIVDANGSPASGSGAGEEAVRVRILQDEARRSSEALQRLERQVAELEQERRKLQADLQASRDALKIREAELARMQRPVAELTFLRKDLDLSRRIGIGNLPSDDVEALIQVVAVLSQRDGLERLWDALRDRCEDRGQPASDTETGLLRYSLVWHNYNWPSRPFHLLQVGARDRYNFELHLRSRQTSTGEVISALMMPGILDGSGRPLRKALVRTQ